MTAMNALLKTLNNSLEIAIENKDLSKQAILTNRIEAIKRTKANFRVSKNEITPLVNKVIHLYKAYRDGVSSTYELKYFLDMLLALTDCIDNHDLEIKGYVRTKYEGLLMKQAYEIIYQI